ncbi:MAG: formylmethanofuran dehydrogenase subunit B [Candidatus Thorarchaeota archaeon]
MTTVQVFRDVPCTFCGCLCDDIVVEVTDGEISGVTNCCSISRERFMSVRENRSTGPTIRKSQVTLDEAVQRAAEILSSARRPLIYGLSSTENDAHREAYRIAELVGAVVDNTSSVCHGPTILGTQETGESAGALAEVRHRADMVIYWGSNPAAAHPRHIPRYVRKAGEYVRDPRQDRKIWLIDVRPTTTSKMVDRFIQVEPGFDLEIILSLRSLVKGHTLDVAGVGGVALAELRELADAMMSARYGVLFFGLGLTQSPGRHRNVEAAIRLIQDLNSHTKWTMMPMRGHYNVTGANKTCTWVTGYPFAVDFARGYPRYQPGEYSAVDMLSRGEVDAMLNVAADPVAHFPHGAVREIMRIPVINIDPKINMTSMVAEVNIPSAIAGIECDGAATRMDGLPLYLRKLVEPPDGVLPDREVLSLILERLREVRRG